MTAPLSIVLPWPLSDLSPNTRIHWAKLAKAKKAYRRECWADALVAGAADFAKDIPSDKKLSVHLEFVPPNRHRYDEDNMVARMKSGLDGIADALGIDDRMFKLSQEIAEGIGGFVRVTVMEME
jgi:crossover junction endodeoxyribonuclease RusA